MTATMAKTKIICINGTFPIVDPVGKYKCGMSRGQADQASPQGLRSGMNIFAYGTLQNREIIESLIDRKVVIEKARLVGFKVYGLKNRYYPAMLPDGHSVAPGFLLRGISDEELEIINEWEGDEYRPVTVSVEGADAICYVWASTRNNLIDGWSNENFRRNDIEYVIGAKIPAFLKTRRTAEQ
jgi:gamma-glutamylcyclotransferase (GGCT)/AIG2-like uncharacterized protein YtfP